MISDLRLYFSKITRLLLKLVTRFSFGSPIKNITNIFKIVGIIREILDAPTSLEFPNIGDTDLRKAF
jgi:hypothetical protein